MNPVRLNTDLERLPEAQLTVPRENFIYSLSFQNVPPANLWLEREPVWVTEAVAGRVAWCIRRVHVY